MVLAPFIAALGAVSVACIVTWLWAWIYDGRDVKQIQPVIWVVLALGVACFFALLALFMITGWIPFAVEAVNK